MQKEFTTTSARQTQKLGGMLAKELKGGEIICLTGELGSGKTTFTQGFLKGLKIEGPYTSPTFVIMKHYHITHNIEHTAKNKKMSHPPSSILHDAYHIDAYRIKSSDMLNLGWEEIIADPGNVVIIEWADRIRDIIPDNAIWIEFSWIDEKRRKATFKSKA